MCKKNKLNPKLTNYTTPDQNKTINSVKFYSKSELTNGYNSTHFENTLLKYLREKLKLLSDSNVDTNSDLDSSIKSDSSEPTPIATMDSVTAVLAVQILATGNQS